jgi:hypothetical protein
MDLRTAFGDSHAHAEVPEEGAVGGALAPRLRRGHDTRHRTLNIELTSIGLFDLLDHLFFSFSAPVSRGARKGRVGPARQAKGCLFAGEPRNFVLWGFTRHSPLSFLLLAGTANPEGVRQLTDKAEAGRAASAQASFPSHRAREKTMPEKVGDYSCGKGLKLNCWGHSHARRIAQSPPELFQTDYARIGRL